MLLIVYHIQSNMYSLHIPSSIHSSLSHHIFATITHMSDKTSLLKIIRDDVWNLKESPLYEYRTQNNYYPVLGQGDHNASIMFIGEAPGENEAKTGKPFCGAAGRILDELMQTIGLNRETVYVTNIVKDRPPDNRDPKPAELELYSPFLTRQIEVIQPKVLATLGRFSMKFILEKFNCEEQTIPISKLHGKVVHAKAEFGDLVIIPLYHPAVALYNPPIKKSLQEDFQILKNYI